MANAKIEIRKGVPMPPRSLHGNGKYPWHEMEVTDSFLWHGKTIASAQATANVASARYAPKKFKARMVDGQIAIWRVE